MMIRIPSRKSLKPSSRIGGRFPIKRVVGEKVAVTADIYKEGHDKLAAVLKVRRVGEKRMA
jgi:hypothetical protein